jgi:hypothetical protein
VTQISKVFEYQLDRFLPIDRSLLPLLINLSERFEAHLYGLLFPLAGCSANAIDS